MLIIIKRSVGIGIVFGGHHEFDLKSKSVSESIVRVILE